MAKPNVAGRSVCADLAVLLDLAQIQRLISELETTRWTGRPGYPIKAMVGICLAKSLYAIPTWTWVVALVAEHTELQEVLGCKGNPPSVHAAYRFAAKLHKHNDVLQRCIDEVVEDLGKKLPACGKDIAIDASDMPAYANGQRYISKDGPERESFSDPDASWGHRSAISTRKGGGFYGYRIHAAVCTTTDLPVAWTVETARDHETLSVSPLIETARRRGATVATAAMDKGYDNNRVYAECAERDCLPLIPLRQTAEVKWGAAEPPACPHGTWMFAGSDRKRGASKWRCPTGECKPASAWLKADRLHPLIPRQTKRWKKLYRRRASVERAFGRLKHEWGLKPLRVRGLERVRLHVDLTILTKLACALSRVRATSLPARKRPPGPRLSGPAHLQAA